MSNKPTCGPMYKAGLESFCGDDPDKIHLFAAGFVSGQAEKVYLGACEAAMFRPSQDRRGMILEIVNEVAKRYGLTVVEPISSKQEIWIVRPEYAFFVEALRKCEEDSASWHVQRARLCGVPSNEMDAKFHLREGHGQRCD